MKLNAIKIKNNKQGLILFFIHPFAAFLVAINNLKSKYSFTVIFLFFVLFGFTFIAQNQSADSYRYVEEFNAYKNVTTTKYINDITEFFNFDTDIKDIYTISTYYLVSRITDNYHILMALWAVVFSYFFLKAFRFFVDRPEFKKSLITALLAFLFIFSNNIFNINGVRFYTAAWIAVYVIFEIVINKNYKFFLLALITPLIHISYTSFVVVLLLYLLSIKFDKLWTIIFIISFFVSEISLELVRNYQQFLPPSFQTIIWSYSAEVNVTVRREIIESLPLYARILNNLPRYFVEILMFLFIVKSKYIKSTPGAYSVYLFLLVWLSFTNFTMAIPSFGARFIQLSIPLLMYLCLLVYSRIYILNKLIYLIPLVYSYYILYWVRNMIIVIDPFLIISVFPHILLKNL